MIPRRNGYVHETFKMLSLYNDARVVRVPLDVGHDEFVMALMLDGLPGAAASLGV